MLGKRVHRETQGQDWKPDACIPHELALRTNALLYSEIMTSKQARMQAQHSRSLALQPIPEVGSSATHCRHLMRTSLLFMTLHHRVKHAVAARHARDAAERKISHDIAARNPLPASAGEAAQPRADVEGRLDAIANADFTEMKFLFSQLEPRLHERKAFPTHVMENLKSYAQGDSTFAFQKSLLRLQQMSDEWSSPKKAESSPVTSSLQPIPGQPSTGSRHAYVRPLDGVETAPKPEALPFSSTNNIFQSQQEALAKPLTPKRRRLYAQQARFACPRHRVSVDVAECSVPVSDSTSR